MRRTPWIAAGLALALAAGAAAQEKRKNLPGQPTPPPAAQAPRADEPAAVAALRRHFPGLPLRYAAAAQDGPRTRLSGVVMGPAGQELRAAEMVLENVTAAAIGSLSATGITAAWGGADSLALAGFAMPGGVPQAARLEVAGLRVTGAWSGGAARLVLADAMPGRDATLEATALRVEPRDRSIIAAVTLRRLAVGATDIQGVIAALMATPTPQEAPPGRQSLVAEGLELRGPAARLGGLERLALRGESRPGAPSTGRLALENLELAAGTPAAAWLEPLGYANGLRADLTLDASQDLRSGRLEVGALALAVREVAAIGLSFTLDGIRPGADPARAYENATLAGARLRYADQSLLGRAAAAQVRDTRRTEAQVREDWVRTAQAQLPQALREPAARFLRGQAHEFELAARPPRPVPFAALSKPPADAEGWGRLLGLSATAR